MDELDDLRAQHEKDVADRDFASDQTRKKYQGQRTTNGVSCVTLSDTSHNITAELAQLSEGGPLEILWPS